MPRIVNRSLMYYRRGLFRLRDWLHKILVGMGEWFPGCTIKHECLSELFPARKMTFFTSFGLSPRIALFFPVVVASQGDLQGVFRGAFRVHMVFCGWSVLRERIRLLLRRLVDAIPICASMRVTNSDCQ